MESKQKYDPALRIMRTTLTITAILTMIFLPVIIKGPAQKMAEESIETDRVVYEALHKPLTEMDLHPLMPHTIETNKKYLVQVYSGGNLVHVRMHYIKNDAANYAIQMQQDGWTNVVIDVMEK
jgi:hypothetical protein